MYAEVIHSGHTISQTKIQDISGNFRTSSHFFQDIREAKIRKFQDNYQEMITPIHMNEYIIFFEPKKKL
jgi:hypothetical protein